MAADGHDVHVVYTGDTEIRLRSFATVYGTVRGQWRGQTQGGAPLTMPSVQARFVIPDA